MAGRQAEVPGLLDMAGPALATMPIRVFLDGNQKVSEFLRQLQKQATDMIPFEQYGLRNISKLERVEKDVCDFTSLLVIQPRQHLDWSGNNDGHDSDALLIPTSAHGGTDVDLMQGYFAYPLVIQCHVYDDFVQMDMTYNSAVLSEFQIQALCHNFEHVTKQLVTSDKIPLSEVSVAGTWDAQKAVNFNPDRSETVLECVHDLIEQQAVRTPEKPAVSAWDSELSYSQLNSAANRLAHVLVTEYGVKTQDLVHTCFEKSVWMIVSMLAINKAGAAWVPLDPSHPLQRHEQVIEKTKAKLVLASPSNTEMCRKLVPSVIEVTATLDEQLARSSPESGPRKPTSAVTPRDPCYVLFTSGSTGTPKGFVMEHKALASSQVAMTRALGMKSDVRMLQFASFAFDLCIGEIYWPLMLGGCVCIPSEHMRMNALKEFVHDRQVNAAIITPTLLDSLKPEDYPSLKMIVTAGEALGHDVLQSWFGKTRLINAWGPAETCVINTIHEWNSSKEHPLTLGKPVGSHCWIVNSKNPSQLAPISVVGEIVLQGPTLLREYLGDQEKSREVLVEDVPSWAIRGDQPDWSRFYRSGDLGYYDQDGNIVFSSRRDAQVKIRGLRIELGEVEHRILNALDGASRVAVNLFKIGATMRLISHFCFTEEEKQASADAKETSEMFLPMTEAIKNKVSEMLGELNVMMPQYMIPVLFIPCGYMPVNSSAKLDRKALIRHTEILDPHQLASYSLSESIKRPPETVMEKRLQKLWAQSLKIPAESIGRDDSFLRIGGDSVTAIHFVANARQEGIDIVFKDVFDDPRLCKVAEKASDSTDVGADAETSVEPFSLIDEQTRGRLTADDFHMRCNLPLDLIIEDVYPCTKLQEGLMALTVKLPGSYVAKHVYRIPSCVDTLQFKKAWNRTVEICTNLRTRIVFVDGKSLQVISKEFPQWEEVEGYDLQSYLKTLKHLDMGYGSRLSRYALIEESSGQRYFVSISHHSTFDGWSWDLVIHNLSIAYHNARLPERQPYSGFVAYALKIDKIQAENYWTLQLEGASRARFPVEQKVKSSSRERDTGFFECSIQLGIETKSSITKATILRAAWAILLARYSDTDDICFGATVSGRNASVPGLESMVGPVLATVPVRIILDKRQKVSSFLRKVQDQASEMVAFEQYGLAEISRIRPSFKEACDFASLFVVQSQQSSDGLVDSVVEVFDGGKELTMDMMQDYFNYPLVTQCSLAGDHVELTFVYDRNSLTESQLGTMSRHFGHIVDQLQQANGNTLQSVSVSGSWDLEYSVALNKDKVQFHGDCIHHMITQKALELPDHEAIYTTEESMSYATLEDLTTSLAIYLQSLGVKKGSVVALCTQRSILGIVAMLAIIKAGGAFLPLDPAHPESRREALVKEVNASIIIVSSLTLNACQHMGSTATILNLSKSFVSKLSEQKQQSQEKSTPPSPSDLAYILFTSGSTGKPKGIMISHSALCTSMHGLAGS
uniref:Carrier domain-containing protein n=1 Tax=Bionectria ochroleuca TaxID=29856 RepID=A0A8H7K9B2_BIOOC